MMIGNDLVGTGVDENGLEQWRVSVVVGVELTGGEFGAQRESQLRGATDDDLLDALVGDLVHQLAAVTS